METIHVLVVSDNRDEIDLIQDLLHTDPDASMHYHVESVDNYNDALRDMVRNRHDLYLVNYNVPGVQLSGPELLERANAGGCTTPVLLLTTLKDEDIEWQAEEAGAAGFLNSHTDLTERTLRHTIRYAVRQFKRLQETQELLITVQKQLAEMGRKLNRRT